MENLGSFVTDRVIGWDTGRAANGTRRMLASIILAAAIPVLLFGGWAAYLTAERGREEARRTAFETAKRVADHVAAELDQELDIAGALVASSTLDEPDLAAFLLELRRLEETRPLWDTVTLYGPNGESLLNLAQSPGDPLERPHDTDGLREAIRTREPVVGSMGDSAEQHAWTIPLNMPVLRDGIVRFVLSVELLPASLASALRTAGAPEGWVGTIADSEGRIVARSAPEDYETGGRGSAALRAAIARGEEGFYSGRTLEGVAVESVYRALPGTGGWSVHFAIPSRDLDAPVRRSLIFLVSGGLLSLVMAGSLAALVARELVQRRRREAERASLALRASEDRASVAVEAADLGTWCWDEAGDEVLGSARTARWLALPMQAGGAEGRWRVAEFLASIHPADRNAFHGAVVSCLRGPGALDLEFRAASGDAGGRWLRATGRASNGSDSGGCILNGVVADIDLAKRSEQERRELLRRLAVAQEDEQRRIARELHDQVGQTVTGLSLALKSLERSCESRNAEPTMLAQVRWLQELANEIGRDIHRASSDLRPTALDDLGLRRALAAHAAEWSRQFDLTVDMQWHGSEGRLPAEVETALYRVVQEAITNVARHASARSASIVIERHADELRLIIEDDGSGFREDEAPGGPAGGRRPLGLSGMRERIALLEGDFRLESDAGAGTTIFVRVPLVEQAA